MLVRTSRPSPLPPITSIQPLYFHAIANTFAQRQPSIPSIFNSFRTLSIATGVVPPLWPLFTPFTPSFEGSFEGCSDLSALCVALFPASASLRRHMRHAAPLSPVDSLGCAYFLSPRGVPPQPVRQLSDTIFLLCHRRQRDGATRPPCGFPE